MCVCVCVFVCVGVDIDPYVSRPMETVIETNEESIYICLCSRARYYVKPDVENELRTVGHCLYQR